MNPFSAHQAVFSLGETLWNLYGDLRDMLFDARGLRLDEWKQQGRATLVKNGSGRTIYHVRLPGLDMYVKHFRAATPMNLLHQFVRQGRAEKEFHLAHLLNGRGVSTIRPIALGERRRHGMLLESYLLTEAIPNGLTLYELIERCVLTGRLPFPPKNRFYFAEQLARLAATIHETGIEHRDLHERNIIVQPAEEGAFRFFILDLHELRVHREVKWQCASKELARMGRYFTLRTSTSDRLRFFLHYARFRGFSASEARRLAKEVEYSTVESRADFWRRRDTRPQRKNQKFDYYRSKDTVAQALPEIPAETVRMLMENPDGPFLDSLVHWWKIGRATRVAEVELPQIRASDSLIYKQYYFKGWHESLASLFHPNQATRAWNAGAALLLRELPTPRPLMLIQKLRHGMPVTSYLLTERVPGAQTITRFLDRQLPDLPPREQKRVRRGVLRESAMLLRRLHDRRATHRDLKASNILLSTTDDLAKPMLWLIDLDGVQTWQNVPEKHRLQNLTRFYVSFHQNPWLSLTDRVRFLRIYLAREFKDKKLWKRYWREIHAQTEKKISRNLRQGRTVV